MFNTIEKRDGDHSLREELKYLTTTVLFLFQEAHDKHQLSLVIVIVKINCLPLEYA